MTLRAARRAVLHPGAPAAVLLALAAAGAALAGTAAPVAVVLLALVLGAAAGFANSGST